MSSNKSSAACHGTRFVEEWEGKIPLDAIAEAVKLARETFLNHAAEYSPPAGHRKAS
jgi:hypothetical protein